MDAKEELLSFLDLLDLNEEDIDKPLKQIMERGKHSNKHLRSAIQLLQYKLLVNLQESTECENDEEFDFAVKLLKNLSSENVDSVCKIIDIVLRLQPSKIVGKAEHLLQQILSNIEFEAETSTSSLLEKDTSNTSLFLKVSDSILNATIILREKVSLLCLETPLEKILDATDETLKIYFLTNTVPRLVEGVVGYNILDRIWMYIQSLKVDEQENALKVLSCLSDYYLPTPDGKEDSKFVSDIIFQSNFWDIILFGITSDDAAVRKISIYLTKKTIDCVMATKKDINVISDKQSIFQWKKNNASVLKTMWDNYFVLIDSLEEKQGNIVLPSLRLFESINIQDCWMTAAFNLGLKHENTQVRLKCVEYKLKTKIKNQSEAQILLEALNDINIYDQHYVELKRQIAELFEDIPSFMAIFKTMPSIKWSPVPLYHLTDILPNLKIVLSTVENDISKTIIDILKIPCNNVVLRKAVQQNMVYFVKNCCKELNWKDVANIHSILHESETKFQENDFAEIIKDISLGDEDKILDLRTMSENYNNLELVTLYLDSHKEDINLFIVVINEKLNKLQEVMNRQYMDRRIYLNDVIFLIELLNQTKDLDSFLHNIYKSVAKQNKIIILYILSLFSNDFQLSVENSAALCEKCTLVFNDNDLGEIFLHLYKTALMFLKNNPELDKAVLSMFVLKMLLKHPVMVASYEHEMLNLKTFIEKVSLLEFKDAQNESVGRMKNVFYEKSCEIIFLYINEEKDVDACLKELINYIENVLECGGYGCLKWILKIVNKIIKPLTKEENNFDLIQFINRVWTEIEELKSNNQYSPCIEQFVDLITQDAVLKNAMYNNKVISYCNKIIEYGPVKINPLYYLTRNLNHQGVKDYGHLIYVLCEILLYCPVPRKDQRIVDNVTLEVLQNRKYKISRESVDIHFNHEIQYLAIETLCRINDPETLRMITNFITIRIDNTFKNKQRYHANSALHRILQTTLQHILVLVLKNIELEHIFTWCLDLLVKLPHQPSVRICLEWFVTLYFYIQKIKINEEMLKILKSKNLPMTSQFIILYWLLKHKISNSTYTKSEYNIVMDFLLSHTMGQLFNVRLNAQYLATSLYNIANRLTKYQFTIGIIEKTFTESNADRNFLKLKSDFFTNQFDIVANLNPYFIYYLLPNFCGTDNNENIDLSGIKITMINVIEDIKEDGDNEFKNEWKACWNQEDQFIEVKTNKSVESKVTEDSETTGTIQKKYIPWRNMSDVNVYEVGKKRESPSQLIVVASLIDKLPNLGGMARTSEVFGVQTYVVDSLRHLQDKQFQGLSVSAERWINVEEVRPGRPLKEYLMRKKEEGYAVVAAEQTSTSSKLQGFKFPKKTLLLLGHEKEGVPCDLLPLMDHCVEIPQQGYVRSLNVHVTAAIFVWEYARQNVL